MKSLLIYYTMSGNTKRVAGAIHKGMLKTGAQCDIRKLGDVNPDRLAEYDLIGLGSPVINQKELPNITDFIEHSMEFLDGKHAFAFCTHGSYPGRYMSRVVPALMQRGLIVIGWNDWFCSAVYPVIPKPYFTDGHPDETDLDEAEAFGKDMVELSMKIYKGDTALIPEFPTGSRYDEIYNPREVWPKEFPEIFMEFEKVMTGFDFRVNEEKCRYPKCTFCADNCPAGCINFEISRPIFSANCVKCWLCEQTCPNGAIEIDWSAFQGPHDKLAAQWLKKALEIFEKNGRFRRLVPLEQIGWNTPFWKLKKPPRFRIP